ncbi:hypothetical protein F5B21DRAFT_520287 [Xylaria acuta]|nr:hypothetical protein F5B21DRAFT_520287 [Xylaria acuta]
MATATHDRDASASQVMFLNFENPSNSASLCRMRKDDADSLLKMLGLTPGFISSLKLPQKRAIVFLASYAVDWRSCIKEYNDITLCYGRVSKREKALISGLGQVDCEPLDHAQRIRLAQDRIEPKIVHLRQRSYHLNCGISAVTPPGVVVPQTAGLPIFTAAAPVPSRPPQPTGQALPAPTTTSGSALMLTTATAAVSSSPPPGRQTSEALVSSSTSGAITHNDPSYGTTVAATVPNEPIAGAGGGVETSNDSQQDADRTDAGRVPDDVPMANSDATNAADDLSKATSNLATDSSAQNGNNNEETKEDVQQAVYMLVDNDETGPSVELDKKEVQHNDTEPIASEENEEPPSKKRKLNI